MRAVRCSVLLLGLAGCGYHPTAQTDTSTKSYSADLTACEETSHHDVNKRNAKRALDWFSSPVRRWSQIGDATQACMAGKGYGGLRWCTADELKGATRNGNLIVTASGVQCSDPPAAERRKPI